MRTWHSVKSITHPATATITFIPNEKFFVSCALNPRNCSQQSSIRRPCARRHAQSITQNSPPPLFSQFPVTNFNLPPPRGKNHKTSTLLPSSCPLHAIYSRWIFNEIGGEERRKENGRVNQRRENRARNCFVSG